MTDAATQVFQKKPVQVEVRHHPPDADHYQAAAVAAWCGGRVTSDGIVIPTLERDMLARPGWWIIRGVEGEFYACEPAIFTKTYRVVKVRPKPVPPDGVPFDDKETWDRYFTDALLHMLEKGPENWAMLRDAEVPA